MASRRVPNPEREESPKPYKDMFHKRGAKNLNNLLSKRSAAESRSRSRFGASGRRGPSGTGGQASRTPIGRPHPLHGVRRRQPSHSQTPLAISSSQHQPPTHESRRISRQAEESEHHASYGEYGRNSTPVYSSAVSVQAPNGDGPGLSETSTWANTSTNTGLTVANVSQLPWTGSLLPNSQFPLPNWQHFSQPPTLIAPDITTAYPDVLPLSHQQNFKLTGPNKMQRSLSAMFEQKYPVSFLSARVAATLGCELPLCHPNQQSYGGPAGLITPTHFVQNILVECHLFGIQALPISNIFVVPELSPGIDMIIGKGMILMMQNFAQQRLNFQHSPIPEGIL